MTVSKKLIGATFLSVVLFVGCSGKNPVAGKKMSLSAGGASFIYIFEKDQFYMEGLEGMKMNYRYDKDSDSIIYTEIDGTEKKTVQWILNRTKKIQVVSAT